MLIIANLSSKPLYSHSYSSRPRLSHPHILWIPPLRHALCAPPGPSLPPFIGRHRGTSSYSAGEECRRAALAGTTRTHAWHGLHVPPCPASGPHVPRGQAPAQGGSTPYRDKGTRSIAAGRWDGATLAVVGAGACHCRRGRAGTPTALQQYPGWPRALPQYSARRQQCRARQRETVGKEASLRVVCPLLTTPCTANGQRNENNGNGRKKGTENDGRQMAAVLATGQW
eukprot:gene22405-biopygen7203